jgi:hypothetical protein
VSLKAVEGTPTDRRVGWNELGSVLRANKCATHRPVDRSHQQRARRRVWIPHHLGWRETGHLNKTRQMTHAEPSGFFTGFEGYSTAAAEDFGRIFTDGLVVPDANVLLNLYRYNDQTRDELFVILESLGEQLWVPNQVVTEFWRNRESVLRDPRDVQSTVKALEQHRDDAVRIFRTWVNRVSLPTDQVNALIDSLTDGFSKIGEAIDALDYEEAAAYARNTSSDPVLKRLGSLLSNKCGQPLPPDAYTAALAEAQRRIEQKIPPGYKDKTKADELAAGDYIVWEQTLVEAEKRQVDVLLITNDWKEDWWRIEAGERRGPRLELSRELKSRAGASLYLIRPTRLLELGPRLLGLESNPEAIREAERVDQFLESDSESLYGGWTADGVAELLRRLGRQAPKQAAVIRLAVRNGGSVSRAEVYRVAGFSRDRSLRGFTRPVNRITDQLIMEGLIATEASSILYPYYGTGVLALSFLVPDAVLPLFNDLD